MPILIGAFELAKERQGLGPQKILLETLYTATTLRPKTDLGGSALIVNPFLIRESDDIEEGLCIGTKSALECEAVEPNVKREL